MAGSRVNSLICRFDKKDLFIRKNIPQLQIFGIKGERIGMQPLEAMLEIPAKSVKEFSSLD
jgi:hypothetical protein